MLGGRSPEAKSSTARNADNSGRSSGEERRSAASQSVDDAFEIDSSTSPNGPGACPPPAMLSARHAIASFTIARLLSAESSPSSVEISS